MASHPRIGRRAALAATAASVTLALAPTARATDALAVAYAVSSDMIALFVANDRGMFANHGLAITTVALQVASMGPTVLFSDSAQISMANPTILLNAVEGGLDLVAIAGASRHLKENENTSLVARAGSDIHSARDMIGKKVGIPGFGSTNDLMFRKWLKNNGVAAGEVNLIEARLPDMKDLLRSRSMDAVVVLEPMRSRITEDATGYRVADVVTEVRNGLNGAIWIATRAWAAGHPREVAAFRAALSEALVFVGDHPEQTRAIEVQYLKIASPSRPFLSMDIAAADLDFFQDIMIEMGALKAPLNSAALIWP